MGFKITKDNLHVRADEKEYTKVGKTYICACECREDSSEGYSDGKHKFRVLDDDGEIYFYGESDDDSCFCPLDWARAWGATEIQYRNEETKGYETL